MPELSESERKRLENLQTAVNEKTLEYGRQKYIIEEIKQELENEKKNADELRQQVRKLEQDYDDFVQELYRKYGDVAIDLDTGEIVDG